MSVCDEASKPDVYEIVVVCRKNGIPVLDERMTVSAIGGDKPLRVALKAARKVKKFKTQISIGSLIGSSKQH